MLVICRSVKGGTGTSVIAAALASLSARTGSTTLVDLGGDQPAIFGATTPVNGIAEWMTSDRSTSPFDTELTLDDNLRVVPLGVQRLSPPEASAWHALVGYLQTRAQQHTVIVDAGVSPISPALLEVADRCLLVVRPCYLALRRAVAQPSRTDVVIVVDESQRALRPRDVESVLGLPVAAIVNVDSAVARRVDAGLLHGRLPTSLSSPLREVLSEALPRAS